MEKELNMHLTKIVTTGLTAAAFSTALFIAAPAQAESRTFAYGTTGSAIYDSNAPHHLRSSVNRSLQRDQAALRVRVNDRRHNFTTGHRKTNRIKISR